MSPDQVNGLTGDVDQGERTTRKAKKVPHDPLRTTIRMSRSGQGERDLFQEKRGGAMVGVPFLMQMRVLLEVRGEMWAVG